MFKQNSRWKSWKNVACYWKYLDNFFLFFRKNRTKCLIFYEDSYLFSLLLYIYTHTPFDFHKFIMFMNIKLIWPIQRFDQHRVVKFFLHHQDILLTKIKLLGTFTQHFCCSLFHKSLLIRRMIFSKFSIWSLNFFFA
jgi:hypothetical protein